MVDELGRILGRLINPVTKDRHGSKTPDAFSNEAGL
jgi:hypothetical protein